MEIISRKEAKEKGLERYFTGEPCKWGHVAERLASSGVCQKCSSEWRKKNREKCLESYKKYRKKNRDKCLERSKKWNKKNREKCLESHKKWYEKNREKRKKYREENRDKRRANHARRRARKRGLTPPYPYNENKEVAKLYKSAKELAELTGRNYHVDHIWPLSKGGVHHPCNLQILEAKTNISKHAAHDGKSGVSYQDFMLAVTAYA